MSRRWCFRWPLALTALVLAGGAFPAAAQETPLPAGDPMTGRALFIGARRFQNGGSPCGACHAVGGQGGAFDARMGPELSRSFEGMDAATVDSLLQDLPFPSMVPVYAGRALTPQERADLAAFFGQVTGTPPPGGGRVAGYAVTLALAVFAAMAVASRGRKAPSRSRLVDRAPRATGGTR